MSLRNLVSTDGEIVKAEFAVDLIQKLAKWNFLWEVNVISAKFYDDYFTEHCMSN